MPQYVAAGSTFRFTFNSRKFSTGEPFALAGTPSVAVYPEDSATQVTSGITLTTDYDSKTGLNHVAVDTTGLTAGKKYFSVIEAGTVDGVSAVGVRIPEGEFYIGNAPVDLKAILGTAFSEGAAGRIAGAFQTLLNVASPVLTVASVNQSGDGYAVVNSGTHGNPALLTAIQNVQNGTYVSATLPLTIELPDSGTVVYQVVVTFSDNEGDLRDLDSGNPSITVTDELGGSLAARLSAWSHPSTGRYEITYTASSTDTTQVVNWWITGTVAGKTRVYPGQTQYVNTTAVDFTSADRTKLDAIEARLTAGRASNLDNLDAAVTTRATPAQVNTECDTALSDVGVTSVRTARLDENVSAAKTLTAAERNAIADAKLIRGATHVQDSTEEASEARILLACRYGDRSKTSGFINARKSDGTLIEAIPMQASTDTQPVFDVG